MSTPKYHDIVLFEYFGEYFSLLHNSEFRPGFARSFLLVDLEHCQEVGLTVQGIEKLPQGVCDLIDAYNQGAEILGGYLFFLSGAIDDHRRLFNEMFTELLPGPQGGDDDTFDYWPGAVETLFLYAKELYGLTGHSHYKVSMGRLAVRNRTVPEWEEVAEGLLAWSLPKDPEDPLT